MGSITMFSLIGLVCVAEWPLITAIVWHIHNGNTVAIEGHVFRVPLLYEPEIAKGGAQIDMIEYPRLLGGNASVTVKSTGKTLDNAATDRWQSALINAIERHASEKHAGWDDQWKAETIRGTRLTFACIVDTSQLGQFLTCQAEGTDLTVSTSASSDHIKDTRAVLETSN